MRRKFNQEMYNYLKEHGKEYIIKEWVIILKDKFDEDFSVRHLQQYFSRHNIQYKYEMPNRSKNNVFKKPIGTELIRKDGMVRVKVGDNKWEYKQRLIYEQYYGVKLTSDDYIIFLDQDRTNFDINNLKCISKHESSILSNQQMFSKDSNVTELGILTAKLMIKAKEKEG